MVRKVFLGGCGVLLALAVWLISSFVFHVWPFGIPEKIILASTHPTHTLVASNSRGLEEYLARIRFWDKQSVVNPQAPSPRVTAKQLRIVLVDTPQAFDRFLTPKKEVLTSWGVTVDKGNITLSLYENIALLEKDGRNVNFPLNLALLRAIYLLTQTGPLNWQDPGLLKLQEQSSDNRRYITVIPRPAKPRGLFELFIPKAYAQTCNSSGGSPVVQCGSFTQVCKCVGGPPWKNGVSCDPNDPFFCSGGSCTCTQECTYEFETACSIWNNNPDQCNNAPCGWGKCIVSGGCTTTGGGAPTPTPPSCTCTAWIPQASCGNGCATVQERFYTRTCTPGGCDVESSCFTAAECACDPNNWGACSVSCGSGTQTNACGDTRSCCVECGPTYGAWGSCSGSPATKSRILTYDCRGNGSESTSCYGSVNSRAMQVDSGDTSCAAIRSSAIGVGGTVHQFTAGSASQPAPKTQSGTSYVNFPNIVGGSYTLVPDPQDAAYTFARACWAKSLNAPLSGEGLTTNLSISTDSDTDTWDVGYTYGAAWVQTQGGDVAAAGTLTSYVPSGVVPRVFTKSDASGYPGVVSYGTSYDFSSSTTSTGATLVSSTNWLVNESPATTDYYQLFYRRFGAPTTTDNDALSPLTAVSQPASRATPYYIVGDITTSGNWSVGNGQTLLFLVDGNLTIGGKINVSGTGFVAFFVRGNITVEPGVGVAFNSTTPAVEGIYITSPTGTFSTGTSSVAGAERFVGKGTFVAGNFLLQRDLDSLKQNPNYSSELFLYNPQLLVTMPDAMKRVPITWQEVAP